MERSGVNAGFLFLSLWLVNYRIALKRAKVSQFIFSKLLCKLLLCKRLCNCGLGCSCTWSMTKKPVYIVSNVSNCTVRNVNSCIVSNVTKCTVSNGDTFVITNVTSCTGR